MPSPSSPPELRRARPLLGTLVEICAAGGSSLQQLNQAVDQAFAAIERVHALMSFHAPDSEVSRLNREAHRRALRVGPRTFAVLQAAQTLARLSGGAFDISVAARLQAWGLLPPSPGAVDDGASWRDLELLDASRVRFRRRLKIDLGGIAKGYAVDCAVAVLRDAGLSAGLVNAGGDLRVFGAGARNLALRDPRLPLLAGRRIRLADEALATSAGYFSRRHAARGEVSALLNPATGEAFLGSASVSVIAPQCMLADALTKIVLFAPAATAEAVLSTYNARALVLAPQEISLAA